MAKEKPFHTATHRVGDAPKQKFFEASPDTSGEAHDDLPGDAPEDVSADVIPDEDMIAAAARYGQDNARAPASVPRAEWTGAFVSRITHDLMNALGAATSFGELLVEDLSHDDPRRQHAEKALQGCTLAMRLVKMLRDPAQWRDKNINYLEAARAALKVEAHAETYVEKHIAQHPEAQDRDDGAADQPPSVAPHEPLRIMVVDGRSAAADSLSQGFDALGHKAFAVYDPQEALTLFCETSGEWDVVLCPVILRGQGGAGLLQKMKTVDPRVMTVLSTGTAPPQAFSPSGCDLVVESTGGAQKISDLLAQHLARAGHRPRVRVVA